MDQNRSFDDAITFDLTTPAGRDYAIMYIAEVGCTVVGINDPSLYDAAMVDLRASERNAMLSRLIRESYTFAINAGVKIDDETKCCYDFLLELYEARYFEAKNYEARKFQEANEKIARVIGNLWERTNATIH